MVGIIERLALRLNARRSYGSLMRTYVKLALELRIQSGSIPSELNFCRLIVAHLRSHKFTTLSNFISAAKKNFEHQGRLPRNMSFRNVKRGLFQMFATIDATTHKVPLRRRHLLILVNYFILRELYGLAFAMSLNYWAALRISELLRLEWGDFKISDTFCLIVIRIAKNHLRPKCSVVTHSTEVDSLPLLANEHLAAKPRKRKVFSFGRTHHDKAIKAACRANDLPIGTSHSFRAGFITDAAAIGMPDTVIAQHARHKSTVSLSDCERPGVSDLKSLTATMVAKC